MLAYRGMQGSDLIGPLCCVLELNGQRDDVRRSLHRYPLRLTEQPPVPDGSRGRRQGEVRPAGVAQDGFPRRCRRGEWLQLGMPNVHYGIQVTMSKFAYAYSFPV